RCLSYRGEILGSVLRRSQDRGARSSGEATRMLRRAMDEICEDFQAQIEAVAELYEGNQAAFEAAMMAKDSFMGMGYALIDENGELLRFEQLRSLVDQASVVVEQHAYYGWSLFFPGNSGPDA